MIIHLIGGVDDGLRVDLDNPPPGCAIDRGLSVPLPEFLWVTHTATEVYRLVAATQDECTYQFDPDQTAQHHQQRRPTPMPDPTIDQCPSLVPAGGLQFGPTRQRCPLPAGHPGPHGSYRMGWWEDKPQTLLPMSSPAPVPVPVPEAAPQRWARVAGTALGWLIVALAVVLLVGGLVAALRWIT